MVANPGPVPPIFREPDTAVRIALVASSFRRLLGRPLVDDGGDIVDAVWRAPDAILAHGTQADPLLFFGNAAALAAFECEAGELVGMPSRLTAEAPLREARQALLDRVTSDGFIDDYAGVRISLKGRRFRIEDAIVWNLVDNRGEVHGQAATFRL